MKIQVSSSAKYFGKKDGQWLEEKTGSFVLAQDTVLVHKSHKRIKEFRAGVITCAYDEFDSSKQLTAITRDAVYAATDVINDYTHIVRKDNAAEYVYTMTLPAGTRVDEFENEYRFLMTDAIQIELIGTMGMMQVAVCDAIKKVYGAPYSMAATTMTINVFTKNFPAKC